MKDNLSIMKQCEAFLEGHFLLSSGRHSGGYCQCAKLLRFPELSAEVLSSVTEHQAKIAGIVERARAIGIPTIAEHVQDAPTMTHLFSAGVDYVEGQFVGLAGPRMDYEFA